MDRTKYDALDEQLALTFPASDPPASVEPTTGIGCPAQPEEAEKRPKKRKPTRKRRH